MTQNQKGPLLLIYERLYVLVIILAAAVASAWALTAGIDPIYRAQSKGFLPTHHESFSLNTEAANLPVGPKIPVASSETQASLLALLNSAELRVMVANEIQERDSVFLEKNVDFGIDKFNALVITAYDTNAAMSARIANTYMTSFRERLKSQNSAEVGRKLAALETAIDGQKKRVSDAENQRLAFLKENQTVDYDAELASLVARADALDGEISQARVSLASLEDRQQETEEQLQAHLEFIPTDRTEITNPRISPLLEQFNRQKAELASLLLVYTEEHPEVLKVQTAMQQVQLQLAEEQAKAWVDASKSFSRDPLLTTYEQRMADLAVEKATLEVTIQVRTQQWEEVQSELQTLPDLKAQLDILTQDLAQYRNTLYSMYARRDEFRIYNQRNPTLIEVLEAATDPVEPSLPNTALNLLAAALMGTVVGVLTIIVMDRMSEYREQAPW
ncbi:MAG: hypothetical protein DWQ01_15210 [Planctomycetota bacterium]|nr:MAG: hypothetical protein DWQ01_15210 [Planctomycetota bacterium]